MLELPAEPFHCGCCCPKGRWGGGVTRSDVWEPLTGIRSGIVPPGSGHRELWDHQLYGTGWTTSQPYEFHSAALLELHRRGEELGVGFEASAVSPHFPGRTTLLVWWVRDRGRFAEAVRGRLTERERGLTHDRDGYWRAGLGRARRAVSELERIPMSDRAFEAATRRQAVAVTFHAGPKSRGGDLCSWVRPAAKLDLTVA